MSGRRTNSRKRDALRKQGSLNRYPEQVTDSLFQQSDFFDANDLVQVKYEMLRHVQIDHQPVSQAARSVRFFSSHLLSSRAGFSRPGPVWIDSRKAWATESTQADTRAARICAKDPIRTAIAGH